jgi:phospholipid/cholesterol/gamma-HCH transport system permease protein
MSQAPRNFVSMIGGNVLSSLKYFGGMSILLAETVELIVRGLFTRKVRLDRRNLSEQMVRVGVRSLGIVSLVQIFIGVILALQMAPPLGQFGQQSQISSIIGIAGFRMLGPIITAIVLSGFAGASIAAELGTMVVAEEIEAMRAMALSPVRFLVVPRVLATTLMMVALTPISDMMIALGGYFASYVALGAEVYTPYWDKMKMMLTYTDFVTGMVQALVFGVLISLIACYEGLKVRGGAEGVGRATTMTVVYSIVAIIVAAGICTLIFYTFDF